MASTALVVPDEDEAATPAQLDIHAILQADNLIDLIDPQEVSRIGQRCLLDFQYDLDSRNTTGADGQGSADPWEKRHDRYLDVAMQVRKAKTFPWTGAANLNFPLLTTAAIQFQARAYPVIVDGSNLVKGRVLGEDPDGSKRAKADRVGNHLTWQLLYDMPGWEEDTDRLLLMLPIVGCVFRKTYYDSIQRKNVSQMVSAKDFVINYWSKSIEAAARFTQILRFYPYEVEERIRSGLWEPITVSASQQTPKDESVTAPIDFLEQHCRLDLDGDGYPEPYVVTLDRESGKVVRIVPCFDEDGVTIKKTQDGIQVIRIDPKRYFTKYGFIPAPDGSFYDIGFGSLLDDFTSAINTIGNQMLDAGTLQNAQGGFIGNGVKIRSGDLRFRTVGEWKRVDVTGGTLAQNIVPLNLPGPSSVLYNLFVFLVGMAKEVTSASDALTGVSSGTEQPTTLLARIEQASKVMTAIFKRIHRSFGDELRILFGLNADFLEGETTFALSDTPGKVSGQDYQKPENGPDIDVVPVSDPTMVIDAMRAVRAQALGEFKGDPLINQVELRRRILEGTGQPDIDALMKVPPPAPDPQILIDGAKLALEKMKFDAQYDRDKGSAAQAMMTAATDAAALGLINDAALFAGAAMKLAQESSNYTLENPNGEPSGGAGQPGGMEGAPADEGVSEVPGGPPANDAGAMGTGAGITDDAAQLAGGGGDAGLPAEPIQ